MRINNPSNRTKEKKKPQVSYPHALDNGWLTTSFLATLIRASGKLCHGLPLTRKSRALTLLHTWQEKFHSASRRNLRNRVCMAPSRSALLQLDELAATPELPQRLCHIR